MSGFVVERKLEFVGMSGVHAQVPFKHAALIVVAKVTEQRSTDYG